MLSWQNYETIMVAQNREANIRLVGQDNCKGNTNTNSKTILKITPTSTSCRKWHWNSLNKSLGLIL